MIMSAKVTAKDLSLCPEKGKEAELFKWFLASYLFGHRISQKIAVNTWQVFMRHRIFSFNTLSKQSWQTLVDLLGEGHYKRYDESTARNLLSMAGLMQEKYQGKITNLIKSAENKEDLSQRLQELKGVGPKVSEIFMREIQINPTR